MKVITLRTRLLFVVLAGAVVALAILTAGFNVILQHSLRRDADNLLRARAEAQLATLHTVGGHLELGEVPDQAGPDTPIWLFQGTRAVERPRAGRPNQLMADSLAGSGRRFADLADSRFFTVPIQQAGRRVGTLVAGISLAPYERSAHRAQIATIVFALVMLIAIAAVAFWVIGRSLRPVARMTSEAADWSEHDLDHRFALGEPHDELTKLAATFDGLLDRLAASLRREQRFSAEISHELRTPLTRIVAESDLALRRKRDSRDYTDALLAVKQAAEQMSRTLETLIAAARAETATDRGSSDAGEIAARAAEACAPLASERGVDVRVIPGSKPVRAGLDGEVVERILAPILENGCRYGDRAVEVSVGRENGSVALTVSDDGPGVPEAERERIFEPGTRGPQVDGDHSGAGLGLALSRRLARAAGGDVECLPADSGARFRVLLPPG